MAGLFNGLMVCCFVTALGNVDDNGKEFVQKRSDSVCYPKVGCFFLGGKFSSAIHRPVNPLPEAPEKVKTHFVLYNRPNTKVAYVLDARYPEKFLTSWPNYDKDKPLKVIIHGFMDNHHIASWINSTKDALLIQGDYNVVIVDWHHGNFLLYPEATENTRLVGAQVALLIQTLQSKAELKASDVHIIGHSLGAHASGYAGARVPGLGRITGLDPAGPYFDGMDEEVKLDPTDADFVDVVHTDSQSLLDFGYGTQEELGHVDFWPNNGHDQPGCNRSPVTFVAQTGLFTGATETLACNHMRAVKFFIESIVSECQFVGYPCESESTFRNGECFHCGRTGCAEMGFGADKHKPPKKTSYYFPTSSSSPFCQYNQAVSIHMSSKLETESGYLKVLLRGKEDVSEWISVKHHRQDYVGGKIYTFLVGTTEFLGDIQAVKLSWDHESSLLDPLHWNPLGLRQPKLFVDKVTVDEPRAGISTTFCADSATSIKDDEIETFDIWCQSEPVVG